MADDLRDADNADFALALVDAIGPALDAIDARFAADSREVAAAQQLKCYLPEPAAEAKRVLKQLAAVKEPAECAPLVSVLCAWGHAAKVADEATTWLAAALKVPNAKRKTASSGKKGPALPIIGACIDNLLDAVASGVCDCPTKALVKLAESLDQVKAILAAAATGGALPAGIRVDGLSSLIRCHFRVACALHGAQAARFDAEAALLETMRWAEEHMVPAAALRSSAAAPAGVSTPGSSTRGQKRKTAVAAATTDVLGAAAPDAALDAALSVAVEACKVGLGTDGVLVAACDLASAALLTPIGARLVDAAAALAVQLAQMGTGAPGTHATDPLLRRLLRSTIAVCMTEDRVLFTARPALVKVGSELQRRRALSWLIEELATACHTATDSETPSPSVQLALDFVATHSALASVFVETLPTEPAMAMASINLMAAVHGRIGTSRDAVQERLQLILDAVGQAHAAAGPAVAAAPAAAHETKEEARRRTMALSKAKVKYCEAKMALEQAVEREDFEAAAELQATVDALAQEKVALAAPPAAAPQADAHPAPSYGEEIGAAEQLMAALA